MPRVNGKATAGLPTIRMSRSAEGSSYYSTSSSYNLVKTLLIYVRLKPTIISVANDKDEKRARYDGNLIRYN